MRRSPGITTYVFGIFLILLLLGSLYLSQRFILSKGVEGFDDGRKPIDSNIDAIYYINLNKREDRKKEFLDNFPAVDESRIIRVTAHEYPENGAVGCLMSHVTALSRALEGLSCPIWCIDHHPEPEGFDALFHTTLASSTCELLAGLVQGDFPSDAALCLMTGILTDTGRFQYATTPNTFELAGRLLKSNLDYRSLTDRLFEQESLAALKLRGFVLKDKLVQHPTLPLAWIEITFEESQALGLKPGATEGWVNFGLAIQGNKAAFLFHEKEAGVTRISFRSKRDIAVNAFAEKYFQGGGHRYAAGGRFDAESKEALRFLMDRVAEIFPK